MSAPRTKPPRSNAPGHVSEPPRERGGLLGRWPFRRKLNVLTFVPVLAVAGMLCYIAFGQVEEARRAADTARVVRNSERVAELIDGLQTEHRQALLLSLRYEAAGAATAEMVPNAADQDTRLYRAAQKLVTEQVAAVRSAFGDRLPSPEADALKRVEALSSVRGTLKRGPFPASNIDEAYNAAVDDLISGLGVNYPGTLLGSTGSQLEALLRANTAHAAFETSVFASRTGDPSALVEFTSAVGSYDQYTFQAERFRRYATDVQARQLVEGMDHSSYEGTIEEHYHALNTDPSNLVAQGDEEVHAALEEALEDEPVYARQAEQRLETTSSLLHQIAAGTEEASHDAFVRGGVLVFASLLGFALWVGFSVLARRSVLGTVLALTGAARRVADATGQELARVADDDSVDVSPPRLTAVPVPVRDEIGELAEAFNQVQVTAMALLERQVLSRRNIAEMFGNVGRRVSNLTARQLALIDAVERGETDPDTLERLYRIDHIAVRLQRNADSLMLLAGIREAGLDNGPVRLSNVVRAALGQIEAYQRVVPRAEGDVTISPDVVGDLTLMLAELLENAVTFSPASTRVEVMLRPGAVPRMGSGLRGEGAVVEITDHGLGMSPERLDEENARLVRRERLDLVPTKVLGLFVVGVLSRRWGIQVTLSRTPGGGVTARVVVPSVHLLPMDPPGGTGDAGTDPHALTPGCPRQAVVERSSTPGGLPRRVPNRAAGAPNAPAAVPPRPGMPGGPAGGRESRPANGSGPDHDLPGYDVPRYDVPDHDESRVPGPHAPESPVPESRVPSGPGAPAARAQDPAHPALPRRTGPAWARPGPINSGLGPDSGPGAPSGHNPYTPGTQEHTTAAETYERALPDAGHRGTQVPQGTQAPPSAQAPLGTPGAQRAQGTQGARPAPGVPGAPADRSGADGPVPDASERARSQVPGARSPRPLRRRVRGATLSATTASDVLAAQRAARAANTARSPHDPMGWRRLDADAARYELDEFEAAIARAERDSAPYRAAARESGPPGDRPEPPAPPTPLPSAGPGPHPHPADPGNGHPHSPQPPPAPAAQHTVRTSPPTSSEGAGQ